MSVNQFIVKSATISSRKAKSNKKATIHRKNIYYRNCQIAYAPLFCKRPTRNYSIILKKWCLSLIAQFKDYPLPFKPKSAILIKPSRDSPMALP